MRRLVWMFVLGCGSSNGSAQAPWTSGSRIVATTYVAADGFVTLAGRRDSMLGYACAFDPASGTMIDCPPAWEAPAGYADAACTMPFFRSGSGGPYERLGDRYYHVTLQQPVTLYDAAGSWCTPFQNFQPQLVANSEIDPEMLDLGSTVHYIDEGIEYAALETPDGFSVVTGLGSGDFAMDSTPTRLQNVYDEHGPVRRLVAVHDTVFNRWCTIVPATIGTTVCVPRSDVSRLTAHYPNTTCSGTAVDLSADPVMYTRAALPPDAFAEQCDVPVSMPISDRGPQNACVVSDFTGYMCRDVTAQLATLQVR